MKGFLTQLIYIWNKVPLYTFDRQHLSARKDVQIRRLKNKRTYSKLTEEPRGGSKSPQVGKKRGAQREGYTLGSYPIRTGEGFM